MANTIKITNRTIEISAIDSDYMMPSNLNVQSVVFIPGTDKTPNYVSIIEDDVTSPVKAILLSSIGDIESRAWIFNQRLRLGFIFLDGVFGLGSKVIFNIGELHFDNDIVNTRMLMKLKAEDVVL